MIYDLLTTLFLGLSCTAVIYCFYAIYAGYDLFSKPIENNPTFRPPVTILKPLCGLDWQTYENLSSFCLQDYPEYQIVFSVRQSDDPSIEIVHQIKENFPHLDLSLVISDRCIGTNLKVSNLANGLALAKYPILVLADSDIRVKPDYLKQVVQPLQNAQVALVTCPYNSLVEGKVAIFEALGIATQFNPKLLTARKLEGVTFALGSTIVIRRSVLDEIGCFPAIADSLSDDFQLGNLSHRLGYQVVLSPYIVEHILAKVKLIDLFDRQIRWARVVKVERFWGYLGLIFTQGTVTSLVFLFLTHFSIYGQLVVLITWSIRLLMAYIIGEILFKDSLTKKHLIWIFLRDIFDFIVWTIGFFGNSIQWRGQRFKLIGNGRLVIVN